MTAIARLPEQSSPTGLTLFGPLPDTGDYYLMWAGPGARLNLAVRPFDVGGTLLTVEHPSADGVYVTRAEARAAANAFASLLDGE